MSLRDRFERHGLSRSRALVADLTDSAARSPVCTSAPSVQSAMLSGHHAHLLDGHTLLVHNAGIRIRELRNATMHHREPVALSDAKTIRMAEHMPWLTRIFVTSVEAARQGASVGRRHG